MEKSAAGDASRDAGGLGYHERVTPEFAAGGKPKSAKVVMASRSEYPIVVKRTRDELAIRIRVLDRNWQ
jgi:hypothetical protein